jgi:hypothetical protein
MQRTLRVYVPIGGFIQQDARHKTSYRGFMPQVRSATIIRRVKVSMSEELDSLIRGRIDRIKLLVDKAMGSDEFLEGAALALTVLDDTVGGRHPLWTVLHHALKSKDWAGAVAASRAVVTLYEQGGFKSPRLAIAHEIEGSLLDIAQAQAQAAERNPDLGQRQIQLAVAAFLAGAALEDALRRLCDAHGVVYDPARTSIAKLQAGLYQPSKNIEHISSSENKQITSWGDTRNLADHGRFSELTQTEVIAIIMGTRAFVDKHLL